MHPNDDIVGQKITSIVRGTMGLIEIRLSNGMIIMGWSDKALRVSDHGTDQEFGQYITHQNDKRIRTPEEGSDAKG